MALWLRLHQNYAAPAPQHWLKEADLVKMHLEYAEKCGHIVEIQHTLPPPLRLHQNDAAPAPRIRGEMLPCGRDPASSSSPPPTSRCSRTTSPPSSYSATKKDVCEKYDRP
jgi:hypothetical protein